MAGHDELYCFKLRVKSYWLDFVSRRQGSISETCHACKRNLSPSARSCFVTMSMRWPPEYQ